MDDNQSGDLSLNEFKNGLRDTGLQLSDQEFDELFKVFDKDGSGAVKYDEFLKAIRVSNNLTIDFI